MSKLEIRTIIRQWVRQMIPTLQGEYTLQQLYTGLQTLFNDDAAWCTIGKKSRIGEYMVRMEVLRAKRLGQGVDRVAPGTYVFG